MPRRREVYIDLKGQSISLDHLDRAESQLVADLRRQASEQPDWNGFENYWTSTVAQFYDARGLSRKEATQTPVFRIAQDLSARLAIAAGLARRPDYRDELEALIRQHFRTRREFCERTGLAEDMLSHVLSRRKHLSMDSLLRVLDAIGYTIHITPQSKVG